MIVFDPSKPLYVFQLPAKTVSELATALDPGGCWEVIAYLMPGIQDIDIERLNTATDGHPTETLLRIWGSKGYKILDLYKVFYRAKLLFCMQILLPFVDNQFHKYAQMCADGTTQPSQKQNSPSSIRSANLRKAVVHQSVTKKSSFGVYSRRGLSSAGPSAGLSAGGVPEAAQGINASTSTAAEQNGAILSGLQNTLSVKYDDILAATGGFNAKNILGRGGYGVVYRGVWKHQEVAVKRIQGKREGGGDEKQQKERLRQSLQELRTLAKFRHDNILSIYGYSLDGLEPCLIYQFMSNGSLEDRLLCKSGSLPLNWSTRLEISKGVSCGLHFLHSITNMPIIHGDVKSANILLDKHFNPKLGDFGLSRDGQIEVDGDKRPMIASHVKGTLAYLPPEFTTSRILTTKLDVYSFGVVLFELGTGQRAFASSREPPGLVEYVLKHSGVKKGNMDQNFDDSTVELLADRRAPNLSDENAGRLIFKRLISLGVTCTQNDRFLRPTFSEVFAQIVNLT